MSFRHTVHTFGNSIQAMREWEWIERNPFERVKIEKVNNKVERWLTADEESRLLAVSPLWLKEIIIFALNTGMRQNEILTLRWPQVDLGKRTITLFETKNKEVRTIPLTQTLLTMLAAKSKVVSISGYVFTSQAGNKLDARNLLRGITRPEKGGVEDVRFHDLRHTFATRLVQAGVELYAVKTLLGHKGIAMTMRYAHHSTDSLRVTVDVLDKICYKFATRA